jgi:PleD family two-component response regulator
MNKGLAEIEGQGSQDPMTMPMALGETILVVDPCPRERARMIEGLLLAGFQVASASSVADAFYRAVSMMPDLILVAMAIPSSNGLELARQLKGDSRLRAIPIVTYGDNAIAEAVDDAHARFVVRTIHAGELVAELRARIHAPRLYKASPPPRAPMDSAQWRKGERDAQRGDTQSDALARRSRAATGR